MKDAKKKEREQQKNGVMVGREKGGWEGRKRGR
jgi:hypothetical protein